MKPLTPYQYLLQQLGKLAGVVLAVALITAALSLSAAVVIMGYKLVVFVLSRTL